MFFGRLFERFRWKFVVFLVILLGIGAALFFISERKKNAPYVPPEFLEARTQTGLISENIVGIASASIENLHAIREEDVAGDYAGALDLVSSEMKRNEAAREEALKLSYELTHLAEQLSYVRPEEAVQTGLRAALCGTQITQHLINYNTYTNELLGALQARFATKDFGGEQSSEKVQGLIDKMNQEAEAINTLNRDYKKEMTSFDSMTTAR